MSFCKEFNDPPRPMAPKRKWTLEDQVEAMDWDITGLKMDLDSLKRSCWWHRLALALIYLILLANWYRG